MKHNRRKPQAHPSPPSSSASAATAAMKTNRRKPKAHSSPPSSSSAAATSATAAAVAAAPDFPPSPYMHYSHVLNKLPPETLQLLAPLTVDELEILAFMMRASMPVKNHPRTFWKEQKAPSTSCDEHAPPRFQCFKCTAAYMARLSESQHWKVIVRAAEEFAAQFDPVVKPPGPPGIRAAPEPETAETAAVGFQWPAPRRRVLPSVLRVFNLFFWRFYFWSPN